MNRFTLTLIVMAIVTVAVVPACVWWFRRHPNRSKRYPDQQRMPKAIAIVGWLILIAGVLMTLVSFGSSDFDDLLAFRIASIAMVFGGLGFVLLYRNWYVAVESDAVNFRTIFGREDRIAYVDIVDHRMRTVSGQPNLRITASNGAKLALNPAMYDVTPLLAAIRFKEEHGRWPLRGEQRG